MRKFDSAITPKRNEAMETQLPQKLLSFGPAIYWKEDNICQSIWDKSELLLGTLWGTCQELENSFALNPTHTEKSKHEKLNVHCPSGKWTAYSPLSTPNTTWKKDHPTPSWPHPQEKKKKKGCHFTPQCHCMVKFYFLKLLAATILHLLWFHVDSCCMVLLHVLQEEHYLLCFFTCFIITPSKIWRT